MIKTNGGFLISNVKQIQGRVFESLLLKSGIEEFNGAQGRILYVLWNKSPLAIHELSESTGLAKTTLTSMLDRMEKKNLLERVNDKIDRRKIMIKLTPKAKELENEYNKVSDQMSEIFYHNFADEEIIAFEKYLVRIIENIKGEER